MALSMFKHPKQGYFQYNELDQEWAFATVQQACRDMHTARINNKQHHSKRIVRDTSTYQSN